MQQAVPEGSGKMAAVIGLSDKQIIELCTQAEEGQVVEAVNFNAPGQVVVAGDSDAVERLMELAREAGAKRIVPLSVSIPSHCRLMQPAAESFAEVLNDVTFSAPKIPVVQNVDVQTKTNPKEIADGLAQQLYSPVRWVETIENFADEGIRAIFEFGPGKVLSGLNKRIDRTLKTIGVMDTKTIEAALEICEEYGA
ncbi:ACP S-malonyltransferase, partial [Acidihalobacter prosperus]